MGQKSRGMYRNITSVLGEEKIKMRKPIAQFVRGYIRERPFLCQYLAQGLINYSALTRQIQSELKTKHYFDAILIALRRCSRELGEAKHAEKVIEICRRSRLRVRTNVAKFVLKLECEPLLSRLGNCVLHLVKGESAILLITHDEHYKRIYQMLKEHVISSEKGLVEISVISPPEIEHVPGVVAHFYSVLAEQGVNILETLSCFTDTIFIFNKGEFMRAIEILSKLIKL